MVKIYGIKNCNSMKKAFDWLDKNNISYTFHDYKKQGIDADNLKQFIKNIGLETLINRRGTTWKKLSEEQQNCVHDEGKAIVLMQENTSVIKRPVIAYDGGYVAGFDEEKYSKTLKSSH